jgi:hypothetical protein
VSEKKFLFFPFLRADLAGGSMHLMKVKRSTIWAAVAVTATVLATPSMQGAIIIPTSGWAVHNGTSVVGAGGTSSPTFTPADDQLTVMSPFSDIELENVGDYITLKADLTISGRTGPPVTNANSMNTQLRIGLFNGPAGAIVGPPTPDVPNHGIIIEYSNAGGLLRAQKSNTEPNPFINIPAGNNINNAIHTGGSIQGANPTPISIELTLTRANAGTLDISGEISGMDGANPYQSVYSFNGYVPTGVGFSFNRVGFHFGNNTNATSASLTNARIETNVPEPGTGILLAIVVGSVLTGGPRAPRGARAGISFMAA